ncbi:MAG TPA: hypothetical protein VHS81_00245 [Caulobacteraceae bacterium]|jgi:hypothetical protein|nr:hypothetical protein [Caulobacteraceae bacterium]
MTTKALACGLATALALAAPVAVAAPLFAARPTVAEIDASLARYGARATVGALFDQRRWDFVSDRIGAGDGAFVALAARLAPGADAGTAEDLPIALAFALPRNAPAVLAALAAPGGGFDVGEVCDAPFIEDTVSDLPGYRRQAAIAVRHVADPRLATVKAACLAALDSEG